jgi:Dolichyl-phosphate-mannose-protein mannosyltransferase
VIWRPLLCLVGLYAAIQSCWLIALPPLEGPDEVQHYDHVRYVAVTGHLPDTIPTKVNENDYFTGEWTQEGAYYWALGQILRQTGFQDVPASVGLIQDRHCMWFGGAAANIFAHGDPMPPHVFNGMLVGRFASILFGLVTLLTVFAAVRLVTADIPIATLATACVALVPQFGAQHIFITNDTPAAMWASIASALIVWLLVRKQAPSWPLGAAIGLSTGLAIATKLTAGVIIIAMPLAWWLAGSSGVEGTESPRENSTPPRSRGGAGVGTRALGPPLIAWIGGLLLTAGVAFGRNWVVFGDPLATSLKRALVTQFGFVTVFNPRALASYSDLVQMLFRGIWASIGWSAWTPRDLWIQALFIVLTTFLLACLAVAIRIAAARQATSALTVMLAVFLLHCAAFLVSISVFAGYSARYFLPMIVPFIVIAVIGAQRILAALRTRFGVEALRWTLVALPVLLTAVWLGTFVSTVVAFHFRGMK